ncbi:DUF202 domain-containing protein [Micromonospora sp. NPDC049559]|uniref:DUF202 domain-containing protein n=1 Tax=Micromonospora sp. NPDC049559 TaxID=3155923 RepID=UPI0034319980
MTGPAAGPGRPGGPVGEPGRAVERTQLAWRRTTLSSFVVALLAARLALPVGTAGALVAAAALAGWIAVLVAAYPRAVGRRPAGGGRALPLVALLTVGHAALGIALVLIRLA